MLLLFFVSSQKMDCKPQNPPPPRSLVGSRSSEYKRVPRPAPPSPAPSNRACLPAYLSISFNLNFCLLPASSQQWSHVDRLLVRALVVRNNLKLDSYKYKTCKKCQKICTRTAILQCLPLSLKMDICIAYKEKEVVCLWELLMSSLNIHLI